MFRNIVFSALGAGIAVGVCLTAIQIFTTQPLILEAEVFEQAGEVPHDHPVGPAATSAASGEAAAAETIAHGDEDEAWQPADGIERTLYTVLANFVVGVAVSLILVGLMVMKGGPIDARHGVLWGIAGFVAASLLPSLGLPPELPGSPAAEIMSRQVWWLATAAASGLGIGLIVFGRSWLLAMCGLLLLIVPHLIGAPPPLTHDAPYPAGLAAQFVIASLVLSFVMWSLAGLLGGWLHERLARPA
jgi:cobalt transporter subunit CbtA